VKIIQYNFGYNFSYGNAAGKHKTACDQETDNKGIQCASYAPTNGLK